MIFGSTEHFTGTINIADIAAGSGGFRIRAENNYESAGPSVSAAGDVNGDGIDDLVLGAPDNDSGGTNAGAAYVVFGRTGGFAASVDLVDIAAGTGGFKIQGENEGDRAGYSVSTAGDVNGDGLDDLIVGADGNASGGSEAGAVYVVFGRTGGFTNPVDLEAITAGIGGFKIQGENAGDFAGGAVSAAGDLNDDGYDDLIVGSPLNGGGGYSAGAAYVIFGRSDALFTDGEDVSDLNAFDLSRFTLVQATRALAGDDTVTLSETQNLGRLFVANAGDDIITGSSYGDRIRGDSGRDRLFGGGGGDTLWGSAGNDRLDGGNDADRLYGGAAKDAMLAGRGDDRMNGGSGDDRLFGQTGDDLVSGAAGNDTISGGAGSDKLHGFDGDDTLTGGAGIDVLTGGAGTDRFVYASLDDRGDRIIEFGTGSGGDVIDLSALLQELTAGSDPAGFANLRAHARTHICRSTSTAAVTDSWSSRS